MCVAKMAGFDSKIPKNAGKRPENGAWKPFFRIKDLNNSTA
jgi:hypothetical protein